MCKRTRAPQGTKHLEAKAAAQNVLKWRPWIWTLSEGQRAEGEFDNLTGVFLGRRTLKYCRANVKYIGHRPHYFPFCLKKTKTHYGVVQQCMKRQDRRGKGMAFWILFQISEQSSTVSHISSHLIHWALLIKKAEPWKISTAMLAGNTA